MDSSHTSVSSGSNIDFSEKWTWLSPDNCTLPGKENSNSTLSGSGAVLNAINVILWYTVPPVLLVLGTFGNVMIVVVMRGMRASQSTASLSLYFTALAVSDQCLLLTTSLWIWVDTVFSWPPSFFAYELLCTIPRVVWYTCSLTSAWFLVAMTYQRVTSVVAPHRVAVLCTERRAKVIIAAIVVVACVLNLHIFFTWSYRYEYGACLSRDKYVDFLDAFTLLDLFLASMIPFTLLVIGNSVLIGHVIKSVRFSRTMKVGVNQQMTSKTNKLYPMTVTLILTSTAFVLLSLPTCVYDIYRRALGWEIADEDFNALLLLVESVTLFLWFAVSASNFYLYLLSGSKFREESKRYLC